MKSFRLPSFLLLVLVVFGIAFGGLVAPKALHAQNAASGQMVASGQMPISVAQNTAAVIITGTSGKKIVVTGMKLATVTAGGVVGFYDGATTTTSLLTAYVPVSTSVNNNVDISPQLLGNAWPTIAGGAGGVNTGYGTAGNSLCAQAPGGSVLVYTITYYLN